jgi:hypothetical protein
MPMRLRQEIQEVLRPQLKPSTALTGRLPIDGEGRVRCNPPSTSRTTPPAPQRNLVGASYNELIVAGARAGVAIEISRPRGLANSIAGTRASRWCLNDSRTMLTARERRRSASISAVGQQEPLRAWRLRPERSCLAPRLSPTLRRDSGDQQKRPCLIAEIIDLMPIRPMPLCVAIVSVRWP